MDLGKIDPNTGLPEALFLEPAGPAFGKFDSQSELNLCRSLRRLIRGNCDLAPKVRKEVRLPDPLSCSLDFELIVPSGRRINIEVDGPNHDPKTDWRRDYNLLRGEICNVVYRVKAEDALTRSDLCVFLLAHLERELVNFVTFRRLGMIFDWTALQGLSLQQRVFEDERMYTSAWPASPLLQKFAQETDRLGPYTAEDYDHREICGEWPYRG